MDAALSIACPRCRSGGDVPPSYVGKRVRCKRCGDAFAVAPAPDPDPWAFPEWVERLLREASEPLAEESVDEIDGLPAGARQTEAV